jgi:hypothetical protein
MAGQVRLSCNVTRAQMSVLRAHARDKSGTLRGAVEAAVTMLMTIDAAGSRVTVREPGGETREVIFL